MMTETDQALAERIRAFCDRTWDESIVPSITDYIRIPNKSPHFDPDWKKNGYMDQAVALIEAWCREQPIEGLKVEVVQLAERTPLIYMEIPGEGDETVVLYGHLDKQPEMEGWSEGLGPWKPVLRDDKLYGRGGADDGYAAFASLTAIRAMHGDWKGKLPVDLAEMAETDFGDHAAVVKLFAEAAEGRFAAEAEEEAAVQFGARPDSAGPDAVAGGDSAQAAQGPHELRLRLPRGQRPQPRRLLRQFHPLRPAGRALRARDPLRADRDLATGGGEAGPPRAATRLGGAPE